MTTSALASRPQGVDFVKPLATKPKKGDPPVELVGTAKLLADAQVPLTSLPSDCTRPLDKPANKRSSPGGHDSDPSKPPPKKKTHTHARTRARQSSACDTRCEPTVTWSL